MSRDRRRRRPSGRFTRPSNFNVCPGYAKRDYPDLLPYVVLAGFAFMRTAELVRMYKAEKVHCSIQNATATATGRGGTVGGPTARGSGLTIQQPSRAADPFSTFESPNGDAPPRMTPLPSGLIGHHGSSRGMLHLQCSSRYNTGIALCGIPKLFSNCFQIVLNFDSARRSFQRYSNRNAPRLAIHWRTMS